jgi:hypothetical protein
MTGSYARSSMGARRASPTSDDVTPAATTSPMMPTEAKRHGKRRARGNTSARSVAAPSVSSSTRHSAKRLMAHEASWGSW